MWTTTRIWGIGIETFINEPSIRVSVPPWQLIYQQKLSMDSVLSYIHNLLFPTNGNTIMIATWTLDIGEEMSSFNTGPW